MNEEITGITAIFTGEGKGKTSAALGVVMRAIGHGCKCRIVQFIKGRRVSGELNLTEKLAPNFVIDRSGRGFTWRKSVTRDEHADAAREGLVMAEEALISGEYGVVVLDEILYALKAGLVAVEEIERLIEMKPARVHLILTGRGAPERLIEKADMVTSMENIKHPKQAGIAAQQCMDY